MTNEHDEIPTTCFAVQARLSACLDDALPHGETEQIVQHLRECERCREELNLMEAIVTGLGQLSRPEPAGEMRQRLLVQVTAETVIARTETIRRQHGSSVSIELRAFTTGGARRTDSTLSPQMPPSRSTRTALYRLDAGRRGIIIYTKSDSS